MRSLAIGIALVLVTIGTALADDSYKPVPEAALPFPVRAFMQAHYTLRSGVLSVGRGVCYAGAQFGGEHQWYVSQWQLTSADRTNGVTSKTSYSLHYENYRSSSTGAWQANDASAPTLNGEVVQLLVQIVRGHSSVSNATTCV
jgi:hypothetical protein